MKKLIFTFLLTGTFGVFANAQSSYLLQDFESYNVEDSLVAVSNTGTFFNWNSGYAKVVLVENPLQEGINTSAKVAKVSLQGSVSNPTGSDTGSGIIRIGFTGGSAFPKYTYPTAPDDYTGTEPYYDRLRFKYYSDGGSNKHVAFEPNSNSANRVMQAAPTGYETEWVYVEFTLTATSYNTILFRLNKNSNSTNNTGATSPQGAVVYVDDFEFYNSEKGPTTSIKLTDLADTDFRCISLGNGSFRFETSLEKQSNVRLELVSLDGRIQTIYNQSAQGNLEVPFTTPINGLYLVRMTLDGVSSVAQKIVAR